MAFGSPPHWRKTSSSTTATSGLATFWGHSLRSAQVMASRYAPWCEVRDEITILVPDMNSSLTNTGYFVESKATGHRFFTDDIVIPEVQQPAVEDQVIYLHEHPEAMPLRRHRTKARTPAISMFDIEEGQVITQRLPDMFEPEPNYVDSRDSWSLEMGQPSSSSSPRMPEDLEADFWFGGGDVEVAQAQEQSSSSRAPTLRRLHCNVTDYIREDDEFGRCNLPGPNAMDGNVPGHEDHQQQGGLGAVAGLGSFNQS